MDCRLIYKHEYDRLKSVWPFSEGKPLPDPEFSRVMVAEENGQIKGYWFACEVIHVEPVWLSKEARDGGVTATKLFKGIIDEVIKTKVHGVYVFSERDEISGYLERLGFKCQDKMKVYFGEV